MNFILKFAVLIEFFRFLAENNSVIKSRGSEAKNPKVPENLQENLSKYLISNCLKKLKILRKTRILSKNNEIVIILYGNPVGIPGDGSPPDADEVFKGRIDNSIRSLSKN